MQSVVSQKTCYIAKMIYIDNTFTPILMFCIRFIISTNFMYFIKFRIGLYTPFYNPHYKATSIDYTTFFLYFDRKILFRKTKLLYISWHPKRLYLLLDVICLLTRSISIFPQIFVLRKQIF